MYLSNLRHVPGYGVAASSEHAAKLVLEGKGRFGRHVITASAERAVEVAGEKYADKLARLMGENSRTFSEASTEARRKRILRQREILTTLTNLGARRLHAYELAAILAFRHGFAPELHQWLNDTSRLHIRHSIVDGGINYVLNTTRKGVLKRIHDMLLKEKKPLTGVEIAERLKMNRPGDRFIPLISLAILDHMGLVRKLPSISQEGAQTHPYLHEEHALNAQTKHLTLPTWNHAFQILKTLHEKGGSAKLPDLHRREKIMDEIAGNPESSLSRQSVLTNLRNLEQLGLITTRRVSRKTGGADLVLQLTKIASKLIGETMEKGELVEELRILLLGQAKRASELSPMNQHTFGRMVKWLEIIQELIRKPRVSPESRSTEIAAKLGIKRHHVNSVINGQTPFFGKFSLKTIQATYLPKLRKERPDLVSILEGYLGARGLALGENAFTTKRSRG